MTIDKKVSRDAKHFERMYRTSADPWKFVTSSYEHRKYEATIEALGERRFTNGFEAGCSIGVLTEKLGRCCCDRLLGVDFVPQAIEAARLRCAALPGVTLELMQIPQEWPEAQFDLIVFSEFLYFFSDNDLRAIASKAVRSLLPGGQLLSVNYLGETGDPQSGDSAATSFIDMTRASLQLVLQDRRESYRLDCFERHL